jgi:thiaminase/transcriptional activator TenA
MHAAFSLDAWNQNAHVYEIIRSMPFNAALAAGTLSEARFKHYITQDAHYLIGFGRALTLAGAKAPNPDRIVQFAKSAEGAIVVERALHGSFFRQYGITPEVFTQTPLSPACHHYVSYLLATAYAEPYEVLLGALLPCFWIYAEVGRDIHSRAAASNPYQAWAPPTKPPRPPRCPCASECTTPSPARPNSSGYSGTQPFGWKVGRYKARLHQ